MPLRTDASAARRDPLGLFAIAGLCALLRIAAALFDRSAPAPLPSRMAWTAVADAPKVAAAQHRPILYAFLRSTDFASTRLERELFGNGSVADRLNRRFVNVRIDDRSDDGVENASVVTALEAQFGIDRFPTLVVVDESGANPAVRNHVHGGAAAARAFLDDAAKTRGVPLAVREAEAARQRAAVARIEALATASGLSSPALSPDGAEVAFVAEYSGKAQVWITSLGRPWPRLVTHLDEPVGAVRWSPDGRWLAIAPASGRGTARQLYVAHPDGSELRRVTPNAGENNWFNGWTPDGALLTASNRANRRGIDAGLTAVDGRWTPLAPDAMPLDATRGGGRVLLLRRNGALASLLLLEQGRERRLIDSRPGDTFYGRFDAAGEHVYLATNHGHDRSGFARVRLRDRALEPLWFRDDADLEAGAFSDDGRLAALVWQKEGRNELALVDLATGVRRFLATPTDLLGQPVFSRDGRTLVVVGGGATSPGDLFIVDVASGRTRQLTDSSIPSVGAADLVRPTLFRYTAADGLPLSGWLYRPSNARGAGPLVIAFHGGPAQEAVPELDAGIQALVMRGISVFTPNVRGSAGFGRRFVALDDGAKREDAIRDVKATADALIAAHIADPHRLGVMGHSYGGYLTLCAITRWPSLFAAAVDQSGIADLERAASGERGIASRLLDAEFGDPATQRELLRRLSPVHALASTRVPTLVIHGALDSQVAPWNADVVVTTLRKQHVEVKYLLLPDEGHSITSTENRAKVALATADWMAGHLFR